MSWPINDSGKRLPAEAGRTSGPIRDAQPIYPCSASNAWSQSSGLRHWLIGSVVPPRALDGEVLVRIQQTTSHPRVDLFEMLMPLRLSNAERDTTIIVMITATDRTFRIRSSIRTDLQLDQELWVLKGTNSIRRVPVGPFGSDKPLIYPDLVW